MKVEIRCYATLSKYAPKDGVLELFENANVKDVLDKLNLHEKDVKVVFVNGIHARFDTKLKDGDRVAFFPAVGGG